MGNKPFAPQISRLLPGEGAGDEGTERSVLVRSSVMFLASWFFCVAAAADVTCEQLGNIAQTTEALRNQGNSLEAMLAEADRLEASDKLSIQDVSRVKEVVKQVFSRNLTPLEVLQDCRDAQPWQWRWWRDKQKDSK